MSQVDKSFSAVGSGTNISVANGAQFTYSVSGTFSGTIVLERANKGSTNYAPVLTFTAAGSGLIQAPGVNQGQSSYRFRCSVYSSGTIVTQLLNVDKPIQEFFGEDGSSLFKVTSGGVATVKRPSQKRIINTGAKIGGTAGWTLGGGAVNTGLMATLAASQTASKLVVPVPFLKVGDTITSFHGIGQIESAGNTATLDIDLRKLTSVAADVTDASVGSITQLSVAADTIISSTNAGKTDLTEVVGADETFYFVLTGTTAALTDIALQGLAIVVTEV